VENPHPAFGAPLPPALRPGARRAPERTWATRAYGRRAERERGGGEGGLADPRLTVGYILSPVS
jgi:hypothetical protein